MITVPSSYPHIVLPRSCNPDKAPGPLRGPLGSPPALSPVAGRGRLWWTERHLSRGGALGDRDEQPEGRLVGLTGERAGGGPLGVLPSFLGMDCSCLPMRIRSAPACLEPKRTMLQAGRKGPDAKRTQGDLCVLLCACLSLEQTQMSPGGVFHSPAQNHGLLRDATTVPSPLTPESCSCPEDTQ